jgi:UTP:GlnB (protein PII) uridylyltransferase
MSVCKAMVHINNLDNIVIMDWLVKSMKSVSGTITINAEKEPAIQINARTNRIDIDILRPELFKLFEAVEDDDEADEKREGRMDKLKDKLNTAKKAIKELKNSEKDFIDILDIPKEFTQKLTDNNMTIVLSRKGKEAIILGKEAKPTLSKLISRFDEMQIKSVREIVKLGSDLILED